MSNPPRAKTIMVLENVFERRVYHSLDGAAKGLGWGVPGCDLLIYRLDDEATAVANKDLRHLIFDGQDRNASPFLKNGVMDWKAHKAAAIAIMKRWWR